MNVLVIPEDFRKDQFVLQPIVEAMMRAVGKPRANVIVLRDPLLRGVSQALDWEEVRGILIRYEGMIDLFLLCVDRDGDPNRRAALDRLESQAAALLGNTGCFLAEHAWQELEVWVLAGHDLPKSWSWKEIRREIHPKERYFAPFAATRPTKHSPHEGRRALALEAARRYARIRRRCPEDVASLETRVAASLKASS